MHPQHPLSLLKTNDDVGKLRHAALDLPSTDLSHSQIGTLELILNGALSPLHGYPDVPTKKHIHDHLRLPGGAFCPFAPELIIPRETAQSLSQGEKIVLRHPEGMALAILSITEITPHDKNTKRLAGTIDAIELPPHHTFKSYYHTPDAFRQKMAEAGTEQIIALTPGALIPQADINALKQLIKDSQTQLLILHENQCATEGHYPDWSLGRIRCLRTALEEISSEHTSLCILPPLPATPEQTPLLRAAIAANYGGTHYIAPKPDLFETLKRHAGLTAIQPLHISLKGHEMFEAAIIDKARTGQTWDNTELSKNIINEIQRYFPPPSRQGFALFFTGLSGSGKSTLANALTAHLKEIGNRPVTLLDGDIVRKNLSSELSFSRQHRDLNIQRIGFVAAQIVKNHGIAVCAPIAPYRAIRRHVRSEIQAYGRFIEIHISTPLQVCEQRDRKGLYAKARKGLIKNFTGIDDPYQTPENPEITINTSQTPVDTAVRLIMQYLEKQGLIIEER